MKTLLHNSSPLLLPVALCCLSLAPGCDDGQGDDTGAETEAATAGTEANGLDEAAILEAADDYANLEQVSVEARASQHALADTVQFYVAAADRDLYLSIDPENPTAVTFEEGALLVKENLDASGASDGYFAMYKAAPGYDPEGNDWYWLRVEGDGSVGNSGKVGFCKDCHGGGPAAVSDLVFGVPLDNRP